MSGALAGRVALVTGASSGIGQATALAFADAGAKVAVIARRADRLEELVGKIDAGGGEALALPLDVNDEADAAKAVQDTLARFGRLDILVNAAGMTQVGKVENANIEDWRTVHSVNFWAALYLCKAAIPALKVQGGDIVNISSTAGRRAMGPTFGPYSTSKVALTAFNDGLRQEVGGYGIRVSIIEPGATATEIHEAIKDEQVREGTRAHLQKPGAMQPEDVASAILFVVSLPSHLNVSQLMIRPSTDLSPT
jgi:NADP-dependent 3-hydroxy acid dehydrogenase YdfG